MIGLRAARPANDQELYERHAASWWDPRAPAFRSLHAVNEHRLRVLRGWLGESFEARVVADLGCGGGLLADVLEHVPDFAAVLREAARVLRPGGAAFVNTLSRTWRARLLAVQLGEGVGLIPRGTHAPELFIAPCDLARRAWGCGLALEALAGESLNVLATLPGWAISLRPSADRSIGYSALLRKTVAS